LAGLDDNMRKAFLTSILSGNISIDDVPKLSKEWKVIFFTHLINYNNYMKDRNHAEKILFFDLNVKSWGGVRREYGNWVEEDFKTYIPALIWGFQIVDPPSQETF